MNIIGISAFFHDAACCLLQNGELKAAAEEERFSRVKADPSIPGYSLKFCLKQAGLKINDIDCIAYYEDPEKKLARQLWSGVLNSSPELFKKNDPKMVETQIREVLGFNGSIMYVDHHMSHGASSFFYSGYEEAAIFTVDGVGEWATTTYGTGKNNSIKIFEEVEFPDSIGLLYSTITSYLGFGVNDGEYKVMGLAPYGSTSFVNKIRQLIVMEAGGQYRLNMEYFDFLAGHCMYSPTMIDLIGIPPRVEDSEITSIHQDIAKSLQVVLEEVLIEKGKYLYEQTGLENLCMAGGVALNCVANGKILKNTPFKKLFIQPASNDAGGALGAAAFAYTKLTGKKVKALDQVYLGPSFSYTEIKKFLDASGIIYKDFIDDKEEFYKSVSDKINDGKVIGWFQGRMEFGPRSLGARSIIADPRNPQMRDRINAMVKKREGFRPFAPAVLDTKANEHFDIDHPSPYMLETCQVISELKLPAITHVDGSARVQTVSKESNRRFYDLITAFDQLTGCPILLNTSFNIKGEPIVCTPEDAIKCFITTDIDSLALGDIIINRIDNDFIFLKNLLMFEQNLSVSGIVNNVYTFV